MSTRYTVVEQWPYRVVRTFDTLDEAKAFILINRGELTLPIITVKSVGASTFAPRLVISH